MTATSNMPHLDAILSRLSNPEKLSLYKRLREWYITERIEEKASGIEDETIKAQKNKTWEFVNKILEGFDNRFDNYDSRSRRRW